jgi:hypothetical protein
VYLKKETVTVKTIFYCLLALLASSHDSNEPGEEFCNIRNTTTKDGESLAYKVYYSAAGLYVNAGSATFTNKLEKFNGKPVYHAVGEGGSNSKYDWIYKVRDKYETYIDTATMQPYKFIRNVQEGKTKKYESITFNHSAHTVITDTGVVKVPSCIQDVLSTIYFARNIDFSKYKKNDKIPFKMFLEGQVYNLHIRYLGKEDVKTTFGKFKAIKFKALLVEGTIFSGGENMIVWVSDDENKVPVRIQSPIVIGSIKADLVEFKNLRYPFSALKKAK